MATGEQQPLTALAVARIRLLRHERGLTAHQLDAAAGVPHHTTGKLECGQRKNLTVDWLAQYAAALGTTPTELLAGWEGYRDA